MKKRIMKKTLIYGGALILMLSACSKIKDTAEGAESLAQSSEDYSNDMAVLTDLSEFFKEIVSSDPNASFKTGSSRLSSLAEITYKDGDSTFDDDNGIVLLVSIGDVANYNIDSTINFEENKQYIAGDGKLRLGAFEISVSKPFNEDGCEIIVKKPKILYIAKTERNLFYHRTAIKCISPNFIRILRKPGNKWEVEIYNTIFDTLTKYYDQDGQLREQWAKTEFYGLYEITQTGGLDTPNDVSDNEFETVGSTNGVNAFGDVYEAAITQKLIQKRNSCATIPVSGKIELETSSSKLHAALDFGNGACDQQAQVVVNPGNIKSTITIK